MLVTMALYFLILNISHIKGLREFQGRIPNGEVTGLFRSKSLGHRKPLEADTFLELNQFAIDFQNNDYQWTIEFCLMDSDNDGFSNGEELGDPHCLFDPDSSSSFESPIVSHPGDIDSTPIDPKFDTFLATMYEDYVLYSHSFSAFFAWFVFFPFSMMFLWKKADDKTPFIFIHSVLSAVAITMTSIGIAFMFFLRGSNPEIYFYSAHARVGLLLVVLSYVIMIPSCFAMKDFKKRYCFLFYIHRFGGILAFLLCPLVLFLGFHSELVEYYQETLELWQVLLIFYAIGALLYIFMPCCCCCEIFSKKEDIVGTSEPKNVKKERLLLQRRYSSGSLPSVQQDYDGFEQEEDEELNNRESSRIDSDPYHTSVVGNPHPMLQKSDSERSIPSSKPGQLPALPIRPSNRSSRLRLSAASRITDEL